MMKNTLNRAGLALVAAAVTTTALAGEASAHVRVTPDTAKPGQYSTVAFKVPTESDTASTTKVEIDLPTDHPFAYAAYQPVPGWTVKVTTSKLAKPITTHDGTITEAPTKITWTAGKDAAIKPHEFQSFPVSLGPVPDTGTVTFAAHQTYSDGTAVHWNEKPNGAKEPEHPAPVLYVKDKAPDAAPTQNGSNTSAPAATPSSDGGSDTTARWLGAGGIVVGLLGLVAAAWALTRRPRA